MIEIDNYDFGLLKMFASPNRCYTTDIDNRMLTDSERLALIYDNY